MSLSKQEFTDAGRSMLGRAQNAETLHISKIVCGSGVAGQPSDLWPLTALIVQEMNVTISTTRDYGQGTLLVEGSLRSDQAPHAFDLREVGVMAHIGAEADRLYSVANVLADPPDHIDPAAPTIQVFKIKLIIDRIPTGQLNVSIGPSENVTGANIGADTVGPGVFHDAAGNVLNFKRLVQGAAMDIHDSADGNSIYIGVKTLQNDVDLYVPTSYPGISDPSVLFPTIQAAHDHLLGYVIPPDKTARIHVWSGHFPQSVPIILSHPNAFQLQILGQDVISRPVAGVITTAGTVPNISVTIPMADNSGIAINDVVYLYDAPDVRIEGCGLVTSTRPGFIVVTIRVQVVAPPASMNALATTKVIIFPTQMVSSVTGGLIGSNSLFTCTTGLGLLKNFGMRSTIPQGGQAVGMNDNGTMENVIAVGFYTGFAVGPGTVNLTSIVAANACQLGLEVGPGGNYHLNAPNPVGGWNRVTVSGSLVYGIWLTGGTYTGTQGTWTYACACATGIRSDTRSWFGVSRAAPDTDGGIIACYNQYGCVAAAVALIETAVNVNSIVQANTVNDFHAAGGGQIGLVHNTVIGICDPPNNQLGPSGGYILINSP